MTFPLSNTVPLMTPFEQKQLGNSYTIRYYNPKVGTWVAHNTSRAGVYLLTGHTFQCEHMTKLMVRVHRRGQATGTDKMGWEFDVYVNGRMT